MAQQLRRVGTGVALVSRAGRLAFELRLAAEDLLEPGEDVPHRRGLAAAEVERLARQRGGGGNRGRDAIVDVGVAAHLVAVPEDGDRLVPQERGDEAMIAHVGALPGSVDGKVTEYDERQAAFVG